MSYDPNAPESLKEIQEWFSSIITQPIDEKNHINPASREQAPLYITSSKTMRPDQRIELYNQQYWWRLLNTLQNIFPIAVSLIGYKNFNKVIGFPYLSKYPSHHWSLSHLGDSLSKWMRKYYAGEDRELLADSIDVDWAYNDAFFAANYPSLSEVLSDPEKMMDERVFLQPHIHLFKLDYDLFAFRKEIKQKDPDFWSSHHFPNLEHALAEGETHFPKLKRERCYTFILWRDPKNRITYREIPEAEYALLNQFQTGDKISDVVEIIDPSQVENLQSWVQEWISNRWLTKKLDM